MRKSERIKEKGVWSIPSRSVHCASLVAVLPDVSLAE